MSTYDDETPGERVDRRQSVILHALITDPLLWTVAELEREMGKEGRWTRDAIAALDDAGLVHRFIVTRAVTEDQAEHTSDEIVIATRAARRLDELQGGPL